MNYTNALIYLLLGLSLITFTDTLGAISSRKLNFKYTYLSILSFAVYTFIGYLISKQYGIPIALLVNGLLGLYDSTIGFKLSIILKANTGLNPQKSMELVNGKTALIMIIISFEFAIFDYGFSRL